MFRRHAMIVKKKKKKRCVRLLILREHVNKRPFLSYFVGEKKKNSQPCIVLSVYKVSQSVFLLIQPV